MRIASCLLVVAVALAGCSEDEPSNPTTTDTGTGDVSTGDTGRTDTGTVTDTGTASETSTDADAAETTDTADTAVACDVGILCNDMQPCPGTMRCYGSGGNGFCAPAEPECGGFTMKMCSGGRICLRGGGGSLGYCATDAEKTCICDASKSDAGFSVDGCD